MAGALSVPLLRRPAAGALSLLVMLGGGGVIAVSGAGAPRFLGGVHGLPGWTAGLLDGVSLHVTAPQFYLLLAAMAAAYLGVLAFGLGLPVRWLVVAIVALHVAFALSPPRLSTDVFSYIDYARLGAVHGLDPYAVTPSAVRWDPVFRYIHWRHTRSAYGPLFTFASYPIGRLAPADALLAFKALAGAASLGCVALVWRIAGRLGRSQPAAIAVFGLNPMLLVYAVGGAHNDLLMLLALLGGVALLLAGRALPGGALLPVAVAIKASAGLAIPFLVLGARRRWLPALAGVLAGGAAMVALAWVAFPGHAAGMIDVLRHEQRLVASGSVPTAVAQWLGLHGVTPGVRTAFQVVLFASLAVLLVWVARGGDVVRACGWAFVALVACSTWMLAWYTIWPLAFAAASRDRRLIAATLALQVCYVANHVPLN